MLGGGYTEGGIHSIKWKSFMFKSGDFLEENCKHAPKTTEILRQMPGIYTVFFSIIDQGEKYYWHNGEGVIFDDAYLHDAKNDSDEVRVVVWIDVRRKMPRWLQAFNIAEREVFRAPQEQDLFRPCLRGRIQRQRPRAVLTRCLCPITSTWEGKLKVCSEVGRFVQSPARSLHCLKRDDCFARQARGKNYLWTPLPNRCFL